jgi:hypothetical protein
MKDSWVEKHLNKRFLKNYDFSHSSASESYDQRASQSNKDYVNLTKPLNSPVETNFFFKFETCSFQNAFNQQIYDFNVRKFLKEKFYSNPVYKTLLNFDIDLFLSRQPFFQFLSPEEEKNLFNYRLILTKYYDSLREYQKIPYNEEFQQLFNGSKSYINRVYNQQFKGTLNILRRLFYVSLVELNSDNLTNQTAGISKGTPNNNILLKYDQPLFNEFHYKDNIYSHEELLNNNQIIKSNQTQTNENETDGMIKSLNKNKLKFIQETNPYPFYVGWDEQKRKLLVTNRYFPKQIAGMQIERSSIPPKDREAFISEQKNSVASEVQSNLSNRILFSAWPIEVESNYIKTNKINLNNEVSNPLKKWYKNNILQDHPKLPFIAINDSPKLQKNLNYQNLNQILSNEFVFEDPSDEFTLIKIPSNKLKDINSDDILVDILPPKTGGFVWRKK